MDVLVVKPWVDMIVNTGATVTITGFVVWLLFKYVPKFIDGSLDAQRDIPKSLDRLSDNLEKHLLLITNLSAGVAPLENIRRGLSYALGGVVKLVNATKSKYDIDSDLAEDFKNAHRAVEGWEVSKPQEENGNGNK